MKNYSYFGIYDGHGGRQIVDYLENALENTIVEELKLADDADTKELIKVKSTNNETNSYKLTKALGIKYTLALTKHLPFWTNHFNSFKKKDDLADSFLQGVYFYQTLKL